MNAPQHSAVIDNKSILCSCTNLRAAQEAQLHQQLIAASFGGAVSAIVTCPFDVVKTRLQIAPAAIPATLKKSHRLKQQVFSGTLDAFIKITRNEGILTLWRGLAPSLIMTVPNAAIYFNTYEALKKQLLKADFPHAAFIPLVAGALARIVAVTTLAPLELIRTNFQATTNNLHRNEKPSVISFVKKTGAKGLWLGVGATLTRDVPFSAIYWTCYEYFKQQLKPDTPQSTSAAFLTSFTCGAMSGMLSAILTTPIDLVKTRLQTGAHDPNKNLTAKNKAKPVATIQAAVLRPTAREIARTIYREEGFKGFMKGWLPRAVKVGPACAIMISSYELIKSIGSDEACARG